MILQHNEPDDFVVATGSQISVREFVEKVAKKLDIKITWKGQGLKEEGVEQNGRTIVRIDKNYYRPAEVETLLGDYSKAKKILKWEPKISLDELIDDMVAHEIKDNNI